MCAPFPSDVHYVVKPEVPTDIRGKIYFDSSFFHRGNDKEGNYVELTGIDPESLLALYDTCPAMRAAFDEIIEDAVKERIECEKEWAMEARFNRPEL